MHIPVLLHEVIAELDLKPDDVYLDGTINGGGHASAVAERLGEGGTIVGLDLDRTALERAKKRLAGAKARVILKELSFRNLDIALAETGIGAADKILFDLGLSSHQFEESGRGFSFQKDEPLLMTFKDMPGTSDLTATAIVNRWDEENIAQIVESYGEERFAKRIAHSIVLARAKHPLRTTKELIAAIEEALPAGYRFRKIHPATKTFQALRITVNDELGALAQGLEKGFQHLAVQGRMAVISFHSLEDRLVKQYFRKLSDEGMVKRITKKPIAPSEREVADNHRSRSAKLRIIEKIS